MRAALRERDAKVRMLEGRLVALEESASVALGRALAAAARRPVRGLLRLPRLLFRLWRRRKDPATAAASLPGAAGGQGAAGGAAGRTADPAGGASAAAVASARPGAVGLGADEDRLLMRLPGQTGDRMTVAGVFGPALASALGGCAHLVTLLPHNAPLVLDQVDPDLVIVDAAAGLAGGPWAYLGEPGTVDREGALLAMLDAARSYGRPVVLWTGTTPVPPGLARLRWDAVETGGHGVPLHRFNPVGRTGDNATPLFVDPGVERLPLAVRRSLRTMIAEAGAATVAADVPNLPDLLRGRARTLAATAQHALEQLACGARVMCPPQVAGALGGAAGLVHTGPGAGGETGSGAVASAAINGAAWSAWAAGGAGNGAESGAGDGDGDLRAVLRTLFLAHSTPVRLAALVDRLGIDADPLRERRVAVVGAAPDVSRARRLVAELIGQSHPPAELLLPAEAGRDDAFAVAAGELSAHGIAVRPARGASPDAAAASARSPWLAPWPEQPVSAGYLADLVCAAECSGADAVGPRLAARPEGTGAADYSYGGEIEPALLRTALARRPGGLAADSAGALATGARLLTLTQT
jgi:hypothetical protein